MVNDKKKKTDKHMKAKKMKKTIDIITVIGIFIAVVGLVIFVTGVITSRGAFLLLI